MQALTLPFFDRLTHARRVLIAGAGGGFDVFCGLPLYFALRAAQVPVFLANLSFSFLPPFGKPRMTPTLLEVTADTLNVADYFPELHLAQWFRSQGDEVSIYCFERTGVQPLLTAYRALVAHLAIYTVILVDGGTDSLMRGDESGLGTPTKMRQVSSRSTNSHLPSVCLCAWVLESTTFMAFVTPMCCTRWPNSPAMVAIWVCSRFLRKWQRYSSTVQRVKPSLQQCRMM